MAPTARLVSEGEWEVDLAARELRANGVVAPIGSRAFEIVELLARSAGGLVTKDEIFGRVWPGAIVGENTIPVHISAIRKALGADRGMLKTVSGRGYRLLGKWTVLEEHAQATLESCAGAAEPPASPRTNIPVAASALIGRETAVQHLCDLASAYRVVTLTGPGGIGKTTLASEVARRLFPKIKSDVFFIELASLSDPALVAATVASTLDLESGDGEISPDSVARAIGSAKMLLVLDNCEHVIDAAARLVERLVRVCPHTTVIATSRELLRIEGEFVYLVAPLDVPAHHREISDDVVDLGGVQLFIVRMRSLQADFATRGENLAAIAAICRRLDGIPLAIEFAAGRAATLGIGQVAARLDDMFRLLTGGRRTALPRHRTLRATLDWSYSLLATDERVVFRRLAVFAGVFDLTAACSVVAGRETTSTQVVEHLSELVAKSLVVAETDGTLMRYRLLDTTRSYAREKLDGSGEREELSRSHAGYYRDLLERAEPEWESRRMQLTSEFRRYVDDIRAAIDWAFSPDGDALLGVALTAAAIPFWTYTRAVVGERARFQFKQALAALAAFPDADARLEMKLQVSLGRSGLWNGAAVADIEVPLARALDLAERLGDVEHQLRALSGLYQLRRDWGTRTALARRYFALASTPSDRLYGEFMVGVGCYWYGDFDASRHHLERVVAHGDVGGRRSVRVILQPLAKAHLACVFWVQGFPRQAIDMAKAAADDALAADHLNTLCFTIARGCCPTALWVGDMGLAEYYIDLLLDRTTNNGPVIWRIFGSTYRGMLFIGRGDLRAGLPLLRQSFDELEKFGAVGYRAFTFLGEFAAALGRAGRPSEGLATIDDAINRSTRHDELGIMAEFLRIKGELLILHGAQGAADAAEACFREALGWAERQNALSWKLRAATSLGRLLQGRHREADARACLAPVYDRFTEGFDTADLTVARTLLDAFTT